MFVHAIIQTFAHFLTIPVLTNAIDTGDLCSFTALTVQLQVLFAHPHALQHGKSLASLLQDGRDCTPHPSGPLPNPRL
jgi:hypothetical protein